jgi:hypothetical protein
VIKKLTCVLFVVISLPLYAQTIDHWETIVYANESWKYFPGSTDPGNDWKNSGYNDSGWASGIGGIGYGDGDDGTQIGSTISVFLRKKFTITNVDNIETLQLHIDYDDGFVAYLNGTEIARSNMGTGTVVYNQPSSALHEAMLYQGGVPEAYTFQKNQFSGILLQGENTLAIQVHNENAGSSDLSSSVFLSAGFTTTERLYGPVPEWFPQPFVSSDLPIIVINTEGQTIQDEPKIIANMGVIDNGAGTRNNLSDPFNTYEGKISIEIRGESSQMFPKKSYRVETQDQVGNNLNVALLGLPADNDWILYAPYTDKTMMRDVFTYKLGRDLGHYTPRTRYAEVVINGNYEGVYVLIERIKKDKNRVDIATLTNQDVAGDDLTGGYLLRVDKIDPNDFPAWVSVPTPKIPTENDISFQYFDPEGSELLPVQQNYIKNFIQQFGSALSSSNFATETGYKKYINVESFIDFMLVNEIGKNIDGFVFSTYMYKDKDSKGGLLHMGPLWDFNLAYGNVNYHTNAQYAPGWMYNDQYRMYWFRRLMQDPAFANKMKCRWKTLREGFLSNQYFSAAIDSIASILDESRVRNYQRWPVLGVPIWPNQYVGSTYQEEVDWMKDWIFTRLQWMDNNMPGVCSNVITVVDPEVQNGIAIFPNPSNGVFSVRTQSPLPEEADILLYDAMGRNVIHSTFDRTGQWSCEKVLAPGIYILKIQSHRKMYYIGKVIIH